jgi:predicted Rossmann fold flavoprotein
LNFPNKVDVLIIGAGAAGLMCAITAANRGRSVLVIDHANKVGKKILMSGGGRCNFTNLYASSANYLSHNQHFCKSALSRYTQWDFIELVKKYDIPYHEKILGQLFCDNKSKDILRMLLAECDGAGVMVHDSCSVIKIKSSQDKEADTRFLVKTSLGAVDAHSLVIATGGLSIPTLGASGFGYDVAKQFGLNVYPTSAGLVPFTLQEHDKALFAPLSGSSVKVKVTCNSMSFIENLLFTHRGLSGPAILQISSYWRPGDSVVIDLYPDGDMQTYLLEQQKKHPNSELKTILTACYTKNIASCFCDLWTKNRSIKQYTPKELIGLAQRFHHWKIKPSGTEGYRTAEVTIGGVDTDELSSKTMEAKKHSGLYFIGEVVDVTGHLGGYNFQWAWASGFAAGSFV